MFYTMCMKCGEEWALGDERSCKCKPKINDMTRDDIILMAREAELLLEIGTTFPYAEDTDIGPMLEKFAALVAAAEREACARVCEKEQFELTQDVSGKNGLQHFDAGCRSCAEMIRARGEK